MGLPALLTTMVLVATKRLGGFGANMGKSELVTHNGALVVRGPWDSGSTGLVLVVLEPHPSLPRPRHWHQLRPIMGAGTNPGRTTLLLLVQTN